jgi:hypothetical protein
MIAASLGLLSLSEPAFATVAPFAIACTGIADRSYSVGGRSSTGSSDLPRQVYVLDEQAQRVQRAMEPRQQFEDVCSTDGAAARVDFSPGQVTAHSEAIDSVCDFKVDRRTGAAEFFWRLDLPGGDFHEMEWNMTCAPTQIPVFDTSRNRF